MVTGLGALIVNRRAELGISRRELARRLRVTPAQVLDLERSPHRWQSRLLPALAEALEIPQLELAIASGIITDLPPVPQPAAWRTRPLLIDTAEHQQLVAMTSTLGPEVSTFLLAIAASIQNAVARLNNESPTTMPLSGTIAPEISVAHGQA